MVRSRKKPNIAKKRLLRKKFKRHYLYSNQKPASTQTIGSAFLERIRKVQNSKYEHDLLKMIDCFIDGYGFVNSYHVIFLIKKLLLIHLFPLMFTKIPTFKKKTTHRY